MSLTTSAMISGALVVPDTFLWNWPCRLRPQWIKDFFGFIPAWLQYLLSNKDYLDRRSHSVFRGISRNFFFFEIVREGHAVNNFMLNLCSVDMMLSKPATRHWAIWNAHSYAMKVLQRALSMLTSVNLRNMRRLNICLNLSTVQKMQHQISTFSKPWLISSANEGQQCGWGCKRSQSFSLLLNQSSGMSLELIL